jgi:hypothetical protein
MGSNALSAGHQASRIVDLEASITASQTGKTGGDGSYQ